MRSDLVDPTVHLLVNPASRRGASDANAVSDQLVSLGHKVERVEADGPADVVAAILRAEPTRVIAVGGDGLIHHALPALVEAQITLGIVPSGTGNDFARALGLPKKRTSAVARSVGRTTAVDLLKVDHGDGIETLVATSVTAGFSGRVNATANARAFPRGQLKYTVASLIELRRLEAFDLTVGLLEDGGGGTRGIESTPCAFFAVANTRFFGGGMAIAPRAEATDGLLHLTVVEGVPAWKLALVLPSVFVGQHVRHPSVSERSGTRLELDHDQDVWADGELIGTGKMAVSVVPTALSVGAF